MSRLDRGLPAARLAAFFSALSVLVAFCGQLAMARSAETPAVKSDAEPRAFGSSADPRIDARAAELGRKLRCPVCQGMPIAESPATMAIDMMQQVRKMLAAGQSDADIVAYFTSRYGQWVLLEPPHEGFALWVWVLPPLSCLALLVFAWRIIRRLGAVDPAKPFGRALVPDATYAQAPTNSEAAMLLAAIRKEVDD